MFKKNILWLMFGTLTFLTFIFSVGCQDNVPREKGFTLYMVPSAFNPDVIGAIKSPDQYAKDCIRHEWYFCDLNGHERMMITKDICLDPPEVLDVGPCVEFFECDPTNYNMGTIECTTWDGFPGVQEKVCDKGEIKFTDCISLCAEEVCDGLDNDCDDNIDEGQLNACGECGFVPEEICDGVDNDCDSSTDEDLLKECSTACGVGIEYCVAGDWISCTAPQPQTEICDGFDNDCDGSVDEELKCECTIDHVGVLFPCSENPLLCGLGYKTCECADDDCTEIYTTDCVAPCVHFPVPDEPCDPKIGMSLEKEECNNFDDNCNGLIDEDLYTQCYTDDPNTLYVGICLPGMLMCVEGMWGNYFDQSEDFIPGYCKDEITPQEEVCDGVDNDCDGEVDTGEELQPVDLFFIIDWSGSMDAEIYAVMTALNKFALHYSDEDVLQWGLALGPMEVPGPSGNEYLKLHQDLSGFSTFISSFSQLNLASWAMTGAREMIVDAIYLALHNLVGSLALPVPIADLAWSVAKGVADSDPTLSNFKVSWRTEADVKRVLVVFSDEAPQTYLEPDITQAMLLGLVSQITNTKIYVFSMPWHQDNGPFGVSGWGPLCSESGGTWYPLTTDSMTVYNNLMEIIDENACK